MIYVGTFSKVLFPALRPAYLVVPSDLVEVFSTARFFAVQQPPLLEQPALANFVAEGHFSRHVRRMRTLYAERQAVLVEAAQRDLSGLLHVQPAGAGMHLLGWLPEGVNDRLVSQRAAARGVDAYPLSRYVWNRSAAVHSCLATRPSTSKRSEMASLAWCGPCLRCSG